MHIAGVLVQTRPELTTSLPARLTEISGLEIHHIEPDGRIVVTLEGASRGAVADALTALHKLDGVLAASLVYETSDLVSLETL